MIQLPSDQHITYQLQYRKCGKHSCSTCRDGQGHGPYWYAYWREGSRLRSGYIGKKHPTSPGAIDRAPTPNMQDNAGAPVAITANEVTAAMM